MLHNFMRSIPCVKKHIRIIIFFLYKKYAINLCSLFIKTYTFGRLNIFLSMYLGMPEIKDEFMELYLQSIYTMRPFSLIVV